MSTKMIWKYYVLLFSGFKILSQRHVKLSADLAMSTLENEA